MRVRRKVSLSKREAQPRAQTRKQYVRLNQSMLQDLHLYLEARRHVFVHSRPHLYNMRMQCTIDYIGQTICKATNHRGLIGRMVRRDLPSKCIVQCRADMCVDAEIITRSIGSIHHESLRRAAAALSQIHVQSYQNHTLKGSGRVPNQSYDAKIEETGRRRKGNRDLRPDLEASMSGLSTLTTNHSRGSPFLPPTLCYFRNDESSSERHAHPYL